MRRFLLQSFLYSVIFLGFISCKSYQLSNVQAVSNTEKNVENTYFTSGDDYVYRCEMNIYKHEVSGVLIIKKINESTHRVAMTTNFGNKMIDFEVSGNDFKLNYIVPDLDKKMVINFLKNDFQELLRKNYAVDESFEAENTQIFTSKDDKKKYYLTFNKEKKQLSNIVLTQNNKEKIDFKFDAKNPTFAETIEIEHKDLKINIKLFAITMID